MILLGIRQYSVYLSYTQRGSEDWDFVSKGKSPHVLHKQHGTMIAGVAGARQNETGISGIAPKCSIMPIKLYASILKSTTLMRALSYINKYSMTHREQRFVVNMSFQCSDSEAVELEIRKGDQLGVVYVSSAGNAESEAPHFPSDYAEVISVAAVGPDNIFADEYSNFGEKVNICAPGGKGKPRRASHNIISLQSRNRIGMDYGTSMAAPHVVGAAALVISYAKRKGRNISPAMVREALLNSADNIDELNPNYVELIGSGALNIKAALNSL